MPIKVMVPVLGESVVEGRVNKWHKKVGDAVARDDVVVEVETDKVNMEVPSIGAGTVAAIMAEPGETVTPGQVIALIAKAGESVEEVAAQAASFGKAEQVVTHMGESKPAASAAPTAPTPASSPTAPATERAADIEERLSPAVRRLVREHNLDVHLIPGTGEGGRITKMDVEKFIAEGGKAAAEPAPASPVAAPAVPPAIPVYAQGGDEDVKVTMIRRTIAQALSRSKFTAVHTTSIDEFDMTAAMEFLKSNHEIVMKRHNVNLTLTALFVRALIQPLREFPYLNASMDDEYIHLHKYYNIGVAVDTEAGLIVPNIKNAQAKSLLQISAELSDLAERARQRKVGLDEIRGGTFTITNTGRDGALMSSPVINYPESAILGLHRITKRPVVLADGSIGARDIMFVSLVFDHRIVDGAVAVRFLNRLKEEIENPAGLLVYL